jgi:hypothetical protein
MTPITQPHEGMTLEQFVAARQVLRDALAKFPEPTCHTCQHFSMGKCDQFGEVPAEFQKTPEACATWQWDSIPFASSDFVHDVVTSKQRRMRSYDY